jgi:hypothetical protein
MLGTRYLCLIWGERPEICHFIRPLTGMCLLHEGHTYNAYSKTNDTTCVEFVSVRNFLNMVKHLPNDMFMNWPDTSSLQMARIYPARAISFYSYPSSDVDMNQWTEACMIDLLKARNGALFGTFSCAEIYWFHIQRYTEKCMGKNPHCITAET